MEDLFIKQEHDRWFADKGDKTRLLQYKLDSESIVFDCGGYRGQWSGEIFDLYGCNIHIFEPLVEYQSYIRQLLGKNQKININNFGVSSQNRSANIYLQGDGSSEYLVQDQGGDYEVVKLKRLSDLIDSNVDLVKMNIEGSEYEVIIDLINTKKIQFIDNLLVQFHSENDGIEDATKIRADIHDRLKMTHKLSWNYEFCWESWERI
tara:strand:+ start:14237 stop:14854 length:618 start_codon:yes stop_codon:yes gene_type:complete